MVKKNILSVIFLIASLYIHAQSSIPSPILLWPQGAPGATGTTDEDRPAVIPFVPEKSKQNGTAILVIPGGGFTIRAVDHEGVLVSQWLKDHGITAFLLRYRLMPLYGRNEWFLDGQRAMQYIRANATTYRIDPNRVGAVGFSAGANLVADLGFNAILDKPNALDPIEKQSALPDFDILAYGSMSFPSDIRPERIQKIPPTFMFGTVEDIGSLTGMNSLFTAFVKNKVSVEAHFYRNGVHGSGFAIGDPILGEWTHMLMNWMQTSGFLSGNKRMTMKGIVKLDGSPLLRGMVVMTPVENPNDPPVVIYMTNTGTGELGRFAVPAEQGPIKGKYKVVVRQEAVRWTSNSRDPFMIKMMAKQKDNTLTETDRMEWGEYLRKRNLSPSIDHQKVFGKQRPGDIKDYVINVEDEKDLIIEVFSK